MSAAIAEQRPNIMPELCYDDLVELGNFMDNYVDLLGSSMTFHVDVPEFLINAEVRRATGMANKVRAIALKLPRAEPARPE